MKAIIAEDEPHLARDLGRRLSRLWPELEICAILHDGPSAALAIQDHRPDFAFLDIRMPGMSGLDVAKTAPESCRTVFVTAFDIHAVAAFEQAAADYLMKPVSEERLKHCIDRLRKPSDTAGILAKIERLFTEKPAHLRWVRAQEGQSVRMIAVEEVSYFRSADKYTLALTRDSEYLLRTPIGELLARLDPAEFWQVHRSIVVNVRQIAAAHHAGKVTLTLKDRPEILEVSRSRAHLFRQM